MKNPEDKLVDIVERTLREFELLERYQREELPPRHEELKGPSLLHHVEPKIRSVIGSAYQVVTQSWDQSGTDRAAAFGHSFWPDIIVRRGSTDLLAIELKLARHKSSTTAAIAQMIGQCVIYRAKYPQVVGFLVKYVNYANRDDDTANVNRLLNGSDIRVVIRQGAV